MWVGQQRWVEKKTFRVMESMNGTHCLILISLLLATPWSIKGESVSERHVAVLHVGPHKTGTSAIQSSTSVLQEEFALDSYKVVDYDFDLGLRGMGHGRPTHNLAMCSCPKDTPDYEHCDEGLLEATKRNLPADWNLIMSHEAMDQVCVDVAGLRDFLQSKWDVKIVVAYRRFYDWIVSFYKQTHRFDTVGTLHGKKSQSWPTASEITVHDMHQWLTRDRLQHYYDTVYSTAVHQRYDSVFDDVSILNIHNVDDDLIGAFFCDLVPNADHVCHKWKSRDIIPPNENHATFTYYDDIAVAAYSRHYITDELSRIEVRELIQHRQELVLGLTSEDFPKICADDEMMDFILDLSLEAERTMVPDFFESDAGETALRSGFEKAVPKFCSVDYDKLWEQNGWLDFFQSLTDSVSKWDESDNMEEGLLRKRQLLR